VGTSRLGGGNGRRHPPGVFFLALPADANMLVRSRPSSSAYLIQLQPLIHATPVSLTRFFDFTTRLIER